MSQFDFEQPRTTSFHVRLALEKAWNTLETLDILNGKAEEIPGNSIPPDSYP